MEEDRHIFHSRVKGNNFHPGSCIPGDILVLHREKVITAKNPRGQAISVSNVAGIVIGRIQKDDAPVISAYIDSDDYEANGLVCRALEASSPVWHSSYNGFSVELETTTLLGAYYLQSLLD